MAAPTDEVRAATYVRDGYRCVACHANDFLTFQHRRAVGMGGSKILPGAADGATACMWCNDAFEGSLQTIALAYGWKVRRTSDPTLVPMYYPHERQWYRLEGLIRIPITQMVALDLMHAAYGDKYFTWKAAT